MKKVILTPNPYRDKGFQTVRATKKILEEVGIETRICLPFEVERGYELPSDLRFSRLDRSYHQVHPIGIHQGNQADGHRFRHRSCPLAEQDPVILDGFRQLFRVF